MGNKTVKALVLRTYQKMVNGTLVDVTVAAGPEFAIKMKKQSLLQIFFWNAVIFAAITLVHFVLWFSFSKARTKAEARAEHARRESEDAEEERKHPTPENPGCCFKFCRSLRVMGRMIRNGFQELILFPRWEVAALMTSFQPMSVAAFEGIRFSTCEFNCSPGPTENDKVLFGFSVATILVYLLPWLSTVGWLIYTKVHSGKAVEYTSWDHDETGAHKGSFFDLFKESGRNEDGTFDADRIAEKGEWDIENEEWFSVRYGLLYDMYSSVTAAVFFRLIELIKMFLMGFFVGSWENTSGVVPAVVLLILTLGEGIATAVICPYIDRAQNPLAAATHFSNSLMFVVLLISQQDPTNKSLNGLLIFISTVSLLIQIAAQVWAILIAALNVYNVKKAGGTLSDYALAGLGSISVVAGAAQEFSGIDGIKKADVTGVGAGVEKASGPAVTSFDASSNVQKAKQQLHKSVESAAQGGALGEALKGGALKSLGAAGNMADNATDLHDNYLARRESLANQAQLLDEPSQQQTTAAGGSDVARADANQAEHFDEAMASQQETTAAGGPQPADDDTELDDPTELQINAVTMA